MEVCISSFLLETRYVFCGPENSMDCVVRDVAKRWTQLSDFHFHFSCICGENPNTQLRKDISNNVLFDV